MMEKLMIKGNFIFEFVSFDDWVNNASERFEPYRFGYSYVCLDNNNNVCHLGEDFMFARDNDLFPVRVYALQRSSNSK